MWSLNDESGGIGWGPGNVRPSLIKVAIPYLEKNNLSDNSDIIKLRKEILKILATR
jgi:hypothetical protein